MQVPSVSPQQHVLPGQSTVLIIPSLSSNHSTTLLSNDILHEQFRSRNVSDEKVIHVDLTHSPPSAWDLSFNSNETVLLDIALPPSTYSSHSNVTTRLTFTNITAHRWRTHIYGVPVHVQMDRVETKEFALDMNATGSRSPPNGTQRYSSDVTIGHVTSDEFRLNLIKSDHMHVNVKQVDSMTAELFFDGQFCSNDSSLQINLNLSRNGKRPRSSIGSRASLFRNDSVRKSNAHAYWPCLHASAHAAAFVRPRAATGTFLRYMRTAKSVCEQRDMCIVDG